MENEAFEKHTESGLVFRFKASDVFKPDTIPQRGFKSVKGCDFIWRKSPSTLFIVEVKASAPSGHEALDSYLTKIATQFLHGILLWIAALSGRHQDKFSLPEGLATWDALQARPRLILVVSGLSRADADPLQSAMQKHLGGTCRAFAMEQPLVLCPDNAERYLPVQPG